MSTEDAFYFETVRFEFEYAFAGHGVMANGISKTVTSNQTTMYGGLTYDFKAAYNANNKNTFWFAFIPDS